MIDDDAQINEVVKATLELLGHVVEAAEDAVQARQAFGRFVPDLTLVDYALPGHSGLDILKELGTARPDAIRFLATGMADFGLLQKAAAAGASSMLCKPYRMSDLMGLIETAGMLEEAIAAESCDPASTGLQSSVFEFRAADGVRSADIAKIISAARSLGCDDDVAHHRLPVVAAELLRNAATHGSTDDGDLFTAGIKDCDSDIELCVTSTGPDFDWQKAVVRARTGMGKSRASGLQLVLVFSRSLRYEKDGRVARAVLPKRAGGDGE